MELSVEELNRMIRDMNKNNLEPIRVDRGKRYGSEIDTLANVREADFIEKDGWRGGLSGLIECKNRIQNYAKILTPDMTKEQVKDFLNACEDATNYVLYIWVMFVQKLPCDNCEKSLAEREMEDKLKEVSV